MPGSLRLGGWNDNKYGNACSSHLNGGLDVQGLVAGARQGPSCTVNPTRQLATAARHGARYNDQSPQYGADASLTIESETVTAHWAGADRNKDGVQPQSSADCDDAGVDATCDASTNKGYAAGRSADARRGKWRRAFTMSSRKMSTDVAGQSLRHVSVRGGYQYPYLSQCGSGPTEWKLETQFLHTDGITPINGFFRRALTATTSIGALSSSSAHVRGDDTRRRSLQDYEDTGALSGNETANGALGGNATANGATVSAISKAMALSCMDAGATTSGVFETSCLCDENSVLQSKQCQIKFAESENPPPPPPEVDDDDDDYWWLWLLIPLAAAIVYMVQRDAVVVRDYVRSIESEREKLLPRKRHNHA